MKQRLRNYFPLILLILAPLLMQLPALLGTYNPDPLALVASIGDSGKHHWGNPWIDPNVGFQGQALGKLSADQWLSGHIPWWNAYNGVGLPLAAEAQPASLFLPFVLLMHFRDGGVWVKLLLQILAGLSTFALIRRLGMTKTAALTGALLFELNGTFGWHGAPIMTPIALLPMLLLGVEQLRGRVVENSNGGWLWIPLALAWSIYAGFPETAYINGLLAGIWVLSRLPGLTTPQILKFARGLFLGVIIGLLCATPLIIPFAELVGRAYVGAHAGNFAHAGLPYASMAQSFMPWIYGPIAAYDDSHGVLARVWGGIGGYISALEFFLVLLSVFFCRRGLTFALILWMALCMAKSFDVRPASDLVNLIPLIKSAAFFRYCPPSWEFAQAVLIAATLDGMQRHMHVPRKTIRLVYAVSLITVTGAIWLSADVIANLLKIPPYLPYFRSAAIWLAFSMIAGSLLIELRPRWRYSLQILSTLLIIDACMAFVLPIRSGVRHVERQEGGIAFLRDHVGLNRVYSLGPLAANYGAFFQVPQINYNYLPVPSDWVDYIYRHINPAADPISLIGVIGKKDEGDNPEAFQKNGPGAYEELGVKYVLTPAGTQPYSTTASAWPAAARTALTRVYSGEDMEIYALPDPKPYFETLGGKCELQPLSRTELSVACDSASFLLRREAFYPGWHATVDDRRRTIQPTGEIFQGLSLSPGKHRIIFSYTPSHTGSIALAFAGGLFGLTAGFGWEWRRRRSSQKTAVASTAAT